MPLGSGYGLSSGTPAGGGPPGFAVLSVVPTGGSSTGSTPLVISVTDTTGVVSASFSGRPLTALSILNPTQFSAVSPPFTLNADFNGLRSIAFDGRYIWIASVFGPVYTYKLDTQMAQPSVVAQVDLTDYGWAPPSFPEVDARQIRVHGDYVFVCLQSNRKSADPSIWNGFCVILHKDTNEVVGHVKTAVPGPSSDSRQADCRAVTFDGAGNFFIAQTPSASSGPGATFIKKYSIASVVADFPAYGTSTMDVQLTNQFIEDIDYGGGYVWIAHGQKELFYGSGHVTRVHAVTGAEVVFTFNGAYAGWSAFTVKYLLGKVLFGASPGASTPTPILNFNPNTFPSAPIPIATPNPMHQSGGMAFGQDGDPVSYWFGGYQSSFHAYKFNSDDSVVADFNVGGRPSDFAFDGTKLWIGLGFDGLARVDVTPGSEAVDYTIFSGGGQVSGSVDVSVTNATETATLSGGFTYGPVPQVLAVSPAVGPAAGGTLVTIQVNDTTGVTGASVGGAALTGFTIVDAAHVSGYTADHALGAADVAVSNAIGPGVLVGGFTYAAFTVLSVTPNIGSSLGGTFVSVQVGYSAGAVSASVGGSNLIGFAIDDDTHVSGFTSAHADGLVGATVTNGTGTTPVLSSAYEYSSVLDYTGWWTADAYDGTTATGQASLGPSGSREASNFAGQAPPANAPLLNGHAGWNVDPDNNPGPGLFGHRLDIAPGSGLNLQSFISQTEFTFFAVARLGFKGSDSNFGPIFGTIYYPSGAFDLCEGGGTFSPSFVPTVITNIHTAPSSYTNGESAPLPLQSTGPGAFDYLSSPVVIEVRCADPATMTTRLNNGVATVTTHVGTPGSIIQAYALGSTVQLFWEIAFFGGGARRMRGHVYEVRMANRAFSLAECAQVRTELLTKYGL